VPSRYDTSRGWESDLPGDQLTLPHSGAVAVFRQGGGNDGPFTVLDVTSGRSLWKSEVKGPGLMSAFSVTVRGKDYLVASASGFEGADVVSKGRQITTMDIFSDGKQAADSAHSGWVAFSADGTKLHTAAPDGTIRVHDVDERHVAATLWARAGRTLTAGEWSRHLPGIEPFTMCP
jgi:hypothetical protein